MPRETSFALERKHLFDATPVVAEAIDPGQPAAQQLTLDPGASFVMEMGQRSVVAITTRPAIREGQRLPPRQRGKFVFSLFRQRPGFEVFAAERQFGRLDTHQSNLRTVIDEEGIAVDDLGDGAAPIVRQLAWFSIGLRRRYR